MILDLTREIATFKKSMTNFYHSLLKFYLGFGKRINLNIIVRCKHLKGVAKKTYNAAKCCAMVSTELKCLLTNTHKCIFQRQ